MQHFLGRAQELTELERFCHRAGAGLTFVRGRRRVGKTWLLKHFIRSQKKHHEISPFYYMGSQALDNKAERASFARQWSQHTGQLYLTELATNYLTWRRIFAEITSFIKEHKEKLLLLILDEIQWLSKGSDVVSRLKEAWVDWEMAGNIKVIICGSSSRFFKKRAHAAEATLRGIKTRSSIWVREFTPSEISQYYLQPWLPQEVVLTYMMFGGVPYYYSTIEPQLHFIQAINQLAFTRSSIFLEEIDEIVNLEFNSQGAKTVKTILLALGQKGSSLSNIAKKTGLALSTVSDAISELLEFELVFAKSPIGRPPLKNRQGVLYCMRDFFLNFYCQILHKLRKIIKANDDELIFSLYALQAKSGYYISNFSGHAFELFIEVCLRNFHDTPIHRLLSLSTPDFTVGSYWDKTQEIDLIVEGHTDRISRIIECKWADNTSNITQLTETLQQKQYDLPKGFRRKDFLIASHPFRDKQKKKSRAQGVELAGVDDLF